MSKVITIDYQGKKLRVDLETMKAVEQPEYVIPFNHSVRFDENPFGIFPVTWTSKNLDIDDGEGGIMRNPDHPEYGCYYTWEAAKRIASKIPGWHLPTMQEWDMLAVIAGGSDVAGKNLKSKNCWEPDAAGEDLFGFNARPAGYYNGNNGSFYNVGSDAGFWTATEYDGSWLSAPGYDSRRACSRYIATGASIGSGSSSKYFQYSVRLVKDS